MEKKKIAGSSSSNRFLIIDDIFVEQLKKRLYRYMFGQCSRPHNSIDFWDDFVRDYYDVKAKERWCFASCSDIYDYIGERRGDTLIEKRCNICGLSSTNNYEANTDILPQALKAKWESGLTDEWIYFLDTTEARKAEAGKKPKPECIKWLSKYMVFRGKVDSDILDNGDVIIEYGKVLRRTVYKQQFTVVHDGMLRLKFNKEMKILSWDFCGRKAGFYTRPTTLPAQVSEFKARLQQITTQARSQINYMGLPLPYCYRFQENDIKVSSFWGRSFVVDDDYIQKLNKRLIQQMFDHCSRPENTIAFWDKFVGRYYDTYAMERWCFASCSDIYEYIGERRGDTLIEKRCNICGLSSTRNYEANTDILPQALKVKWESGLTDEWIYFLDTPEARKTEADENEPKPKWCGKWLSKYMFFKGRPEYRISDDGYVVIEYGKVLRRTVYKQQFTVTHDGRLRVTFTTDMKILSWDFCAEKASCYTTPKTLPALASDIKSRRQQITTLARAGINYMGLPLPYCYHFETTDRNSLEGAARMRSLMEERIRTGYCGQPPSAISDQDSETKRQEVASAASAADDREGALEFLERVKTRFDGSGLYRDLIDNLLALNWGKVCVKRAWEKVRELFGDEHPDLVTEYERFYPTPASLRLED